MINVTPTGRRENHRAADRGEQDRRRPARLRPGRRLFRVPVRPDDRGRRGQDRRRPDHRVERRAALHRPDQRALPEGRRSRLRRQASRAADSPSATPTPSPPAAAARLSAREVRPPSGAAGASGSSMQSTSAYVDSLRPAGSKRSSKRDFIVARLPAAGRPHQRGRSRRDRSASEDARISRATIYRTLQWMVDAGIARKVDFGEGRFRFEHSYRHPRHFHLICKSCNTLVGVPQLRHRGADRRGGDGPQFRRRARAWCRFTAPARRAGPAGPPSPPRASPSCSSRATPSASPSPPSAAAATSTPARRASPATPAPAPSSSSSPRRRSTTSAARAPLSRAARRRIPSSRRGRRSSSSRAPPTASSRRAPMRCRR